MVDQPNDEKRPADRDPAEESVDFVADIRHNLSQEEAELPERRPGLLKRVTGILRRQKPAEPPAPAASAPSATTSRLFFPDSEPGLLSVEIDDDPSDPFIAPPALADVEDDFLASRLAAASPTDTAGEEADSLLPGWMAVRPAPQDASPTDTPSEDADSLLPGWMAARPTPQDASPADTAGEDANSLLPGWMAARPTPQDASKYPARDLPTTAPLFEDEEDPAGEGADSLLPGWMAARPAQQDASKYPARDLPTTAPLFDDEEDPAASSGAASSGAASSEALRALLMSEADEDEAPVFVNDASDLVVDPQPVDDRPVEVSRALIAADKDQQEAPPVLFADEAGDDRPSLFDDDRMEMASLRDALESELGPADAPPAAPDSASSAPEQTVAPAEPEATRPKGLRGFITGILRNPEAKRKELPDKDQMDDKVVTSRLSRSLGKDSPPDPTGGALLEASHEPILLPSSSLDEDDDEPHWDRLVLAAGPILVQRPSVQPERVKPPPPQTAPLVDAPDEPPAQTDPQMFTPEKPPAQTAALVDAPGKPPAHTALQVDAPEQPPEPAASQPSAAQRPAGAFVDDSILFEPDRHAVADLTDGSGTIEDRLSSVQSDLTDHERTFWEGSGDQQSKPLSSIPLAPMDELRSILLQDYDDRGAPMEGEQAVEVDQSGRPVLRKQSLSKLERAMLLILALLAVLLAAALSLLFLRPPEQIAAIITRPTGAPAAGAMLPTGLELPGGWYFALERNTLVDGKWKPQAAEWLEGSELPRVVAIPWNHQTEAVIQTFESGDVLKLSFGNNDTIAYKVREVKRVAIDDVSIFQNRRPSLVIVLYREDPGERWVVICNK